MPPRSRPAATSLLCLLFLLAAVAPASAAPPLKPDPSFGKRGVAEPRLPPHYDYTSFLSLKLQPDGSLLAGRHDGSFESGLTYRHYDAAGRLDRGYKPQSESTVVEAVDAEGKTLRAGSNFVERLNPDGTRDPSFGADPAGGRTFSDILSFKIEELLPTSSGKIFVAGSTWIAPEREEERVGQIHLARLDHQGRLDPGFGGDGLVNLRSEAGVTGERLLGMVERGEDGALVLVGETVARRYEGEEIKPGGSAVVALAADGRPDPGYGEGGVVRSESSIEAFAVLPGGALALAGNRWGAQELSYKGLRTSDLYAARLTPEGRHDPGFDGDGIATVDFGGLDLTGALLTSSDGSILIGGSSTDLRDRKCLDYEGFCRETPVLARFLPNGAPDPGFGKDGRVSLGTLTEPFVQLGAGRGVQVFASLPGGGVLAGGGSGTAAFIAELDAGGALAAGYGSGGVVIERRRRWTETHAHAVAIDSRRRILVAGATGAGALYSAESGVVFRFLPNGRLDRGYGGGAGYVRVPGNTRDIAVGAKGDAFVLSGEYAANVVVRVTPRGTIDRRFGEDGVAPLPELPDVRRNGRRHSREFDPRSLVALPGGGVLVGGKGGMGGETRIVLVRYDRRGHLVRRFGNRGVAVLALGRTGQCNMTQLELRRDGRILIAGRVRERGEHGRRPALFQVLPDGSPDRSFGRGGVAKVDLRAEGVATSLAIQRNGSILLAGWRETPREMTPLLFRFRRDGILDRGFAKRMLASTLSYPNDEGLDSRQILPTANGIFTIAPYRSVLAFSHRGVLRATVPFEPNRKPRRMLVAGVLQAGRLLLVGQIGREGGIMLRRYLPR
jgi:uncharacterized delta-60 repeat protein